MEEKDRSRTFIASLLQQLKLNLTDARTFTTFGERC